MFVLESLEKMNAGCFACGLEDLTREITFIVRKFLFVYLLYQYSIVIMKIIVFRMYRYVAKFDPSIIMNKEIKYLICKYI